MLLSKIPKTAKIAKKAEKQTFLQILGGPRGSKKAPFWPPGTPPAPLVKPVRSGGGPGPPFLVFCGLKRRLKVPKIEGGLTGDPPGVSGGGPKRAFFALFGPRAVPTGKGEAPDNIDVILTN